MSFRTVLITKQAKLSYKNRFLVVKQGIDENYIHLSEIDTIMVDSIAVSISTYLLKELMDSKINIIFCDEKHNPFGELQTFYSSHNSSKKIILQTKWNLKQKSELWDRIVKNKILNQANLIKHINFDAYLLLIRYIGEVNNGDRTNREAHAAKVYFNTLFGLNFIRHSSDAINSALNYGYTVLLSMFNKEINNIGYLTQLGIHHKNEFNEFNLSCDLMEPFRILIDQFIYKNEIIELDSEYKIKLISLFDEKFRYDGKRYTLKDIIKLYVKNIFDVLETKKKYKEFIIHEE